MPEFNIENRILRDRHINSLFFSSLWKLVARRLGRRNSVVEFFADDAWALFEDWQAAKDPLLEKELSRYFASLAVEFDAQCRDRFSRDLRREKAYVDQRVMEITSLLPTLDGAAITTPSRS